MKSKMDRRTFLKSSTAISIVSVLPDSAFAASKRTRTSGTPSTSGTTSLVAAQFNAGRSQVNLNFLQVGGDFPFLNCLKSAQAWGLVDNSGPPEPNTLDADGYPISISNGGVYTTFFVPSQAERPGNYVITWSGNGTIYCNSGTQVSGSKTSTSGSGRYVFSTTSNRMVVGISAIGSPHITDMKVFHADDETALNAGQVFGVRFKQRLAEANFGVIRFLNWQCGNVTNVTTWATRKPISYVFYSGYEFRANLYAGLTANNGSAYSATLAGFQLADKATVTVKFNVGCSGPCTLNVNGSGDVRILSAYSTDLTSGGNSFPVGGRTATLVYDATLNAWIKLGGDIANGNMGLNNGCPPELMVQLCAEIGAHPYFVTPVLAIDPATDYMPNLAAYCRAAGPAWMVPRFEGPNELWNYFFFQTGYANAKATAYGWGADFHNWYGKAMSVLGQIVSAAYAGDRSKYQVVCGVQTATGSSAASAAGSNARLASTKYVSQSSVPQVPYTKTPASNWVTHVCCAQYITPSEYNTAQEVTDANAFMATTDATIKLSIASNYASTVNSGTGNYTLSKCATLYSNWKNWALSFGIRKMCGYEGGYSAPYTALGTSSVDQLRAASKLAAAMSTFTTTNYTNFVGLSDAGFTAEFPSCFQLSGPSPSNNCWSVLESIYQSVDPPQWSAIRSFNHP